MTEQQNKFKKWLELNTELVERSMKRYISELDKISANLLEENIIDCSLYDFEDKKQLIQIKEEYFSIPKYEDADKKHNRIYSSAFNKFIEFMQSDDISKTGREGIVYILTNPSMPGLIKIGKTNNLKNRMNSLFSSGVPLPFRCVYAKKVKDYATIEKLLHGGLMSKRENMSREFFRISEDEAIQLLKIADGEDVTPKDDLFEYHEDEVAFEKTTKIRERFNFKMVDIQPGAELEFVDDENVISRVLSNNKIEFEGASHSLSTAALVVKKRKGFDWKSINGSLYWKYDGEILDDRRTRIENGE